MTFTITQNLKTFLEDLKSADLVGICLLPQNLGLRLDFTFGPEAGDVSLELYHILHIVFSQPLDADKEEFCFWVGEIELRKLTSADADKILSYLSYPFRDKNGTIATASDSLIYFQLSGDILIEVVCNNYKILEEVKK